MGGFPRGGSSPLRRMRETPVSAGVFAFPDPFAPSLSDASVGGHPTEASTNAALRSRSFGSAPRGRGHMRRVRSPPAPNVRGWRDLQTVGHDLAWNRHDHALRISATTPRATQAHRRRATGSSASRTRGWLKISAGVVGARESRTREQRGGHRLTPRADRRLSPLLKIGLNEPAVPAHLQRGQRLVRTTRRVIHRRSLDPEQACDLLAARKPLRQLDAICFAVDVAGRRSCLGRRTNRGPSARRSPW